MGRSEKETREQLIDPALGKAGWDSARIQREYPYKRGRIRLLGEQTVRDDPQFVDYLLRQAPNGLPLAVVEAKDESHSPGAGLQQGIAYAQDLGVPFVYSTNGHGIVEQDLRTGAVQQLDEFPAPEQLYARYQAGAQMRGPQITNRRGVLASNPLIQPAYTSPSGITLRYYQERAVSSVIEEILAGKHRALLALATGTGKTFIAFSVAWKLIQSGYFERVLFLADRVSLVGQAYNDFAAFGDARGIVSGGTLPLQRTVHFGLYQSLYMPLGNSGRRLFEDYPPDYFDLVIVDEAHRSGYGDWKAILDHLGAAFHLGMTATPKRTDSIDTFEFFASENPDAEGRPQAIYEYSLGKGIDDGYLATYRVHRVKTNIDAGGLHIGEQLQLGAELIVPEGVSPDPLYEMRDFEREIIVPDRTKLLCEDLASKLRTWGANEKTMIFCVTMEHAEQVRQHMQNLLGPETGKNLYAVRIVSEERDAQSLLEEFQLSSSSEPVVATTVDLLTTGVNVPAVRNIVFMKPIGSITVFKQIIGRGSRLDETTGKEFFRIVDYTDASRLFDAWDLPSPTPDHDLPEQRNGSIAGRVVDAATGTPIETAAVSVRHGMSELGQVSTDPDGSFSIEGLPEVPVVVIVGATGYNQKRFQTTPAPGAPELLIELRTPSDAAQRIEISGVEVVIAEETLLTLGGDDSRELSVTEYRDYAGEQIRAQTGDAGTLAEMWRDPAKRQRLRHDLREQRVDPAVLAVLMNRTDADDFDLLANAAYGERIQTREERARQLEHVDTDFLGGFNAVQRKVVQELLDRYRIAGIEEIATAEIFQFPPFLDEFGGVAALARLFGGPGGVAHLLRDLQAHLYPTTRSAA